MIFRRYCNTEETRQASRVFRRGGFAPPRHSAGDGVFRRGRIHASRPHSRGVRVRRRRVVHERPLRGWSRVGGMRTWRRTTTGVVPTGQGIADPRNGAQECAPYGRVCRFRRDDSGTARFEGKATKTLDSGLRRNDGIPGRPAAEGKSSPSSRCCSLSDRRDAGIGLSPSFRRRPESGTGARGGERAFPANPCAGSWFRRGRPTIREPPVFQRHSHRRRRVVPERPLRDGCASVGYEPGADNPLWLSPHSRRLRWVGSPVHPPRGRRVNSGGRDARGGPPGRAGRSGLSGRAGRTRPPRRRAGRSWRGSPPLSAPLGSARWGA